MDAYTDKAIRSIGERIEIGLSRIAEAEEHKANAFMAIAKQLQRANDLQEYG